MGCSAINSASLLLYRGAERRSHGTTSLPCTGRDADAPYKNIIPELDKNVQYLFAPERIQNAQKRENDGVGPGRDPEGDVILYGGLGAAEIRQEPELLEVQIDEPIQEAQGRVEPGVQPAIAAGSLGRVFAPDTEDNVDPGEAQGTDDGPGELSRPF